MDWQLTATLVIVLLAGAYLLRRGWRLYRRKKNSSGCGSCSTTQPKPEGMVTLSLDKLNKRAESCDTNPKR